MGIKHFAKVVSLAAAMFLCAVTALAQGTITVSGTVTDAIGPVTGVAVIQQGTTNGTATDIDGKYSITVPQGATLEVSSIGYKTQAIVANRAAIDIFLEEDTEMIEETIVVGYGVQRKSDVTGAIASVKSEDLENRSITTVNAGLQGKTAGVQVVTTSGAPGAESSIRVRGYSSNSDSTPLYVVDGLRTKNINYLDPSDIESIEVLKDAASAAIYGAQAGNGVVLVTTKKAAAGVSRISYDMSYSIQSVARMPEILNAEEYLTWVREGNLVSEEKISQYYDGTTDTYWPDVAFEDGSMQRHNISFQGANDKSSFLASLSYLDNDGPVISDEDSFDRLTGTINASYKIRPWLTVSSNNSVASFHHSSVQSGGMYSILASAIQMDPLTPVIYSKDNVPAHMQSLIDAGHTFITDANGDYYSMSPFQESNNVNPYIMLGMQDSKSEGFNIRGSSSADIKPFKTVTFTSRLGYDFLSLRSYNVTWPNTVNTDTTTDYVTVGATDSSNKYWQWENFVNYMESFGKHNVGAMVGMSYDARTTYNVTGQIQGTSASNVGITKVDPNYAFFANATGTATKTLSGGEKRKYTSLSYFGRLTYDYDGRYNLQASMRADAADLSILPLNQRWGYFPAVSAGWTLSRENFFKNLGLGNVNYIKFRASWGQNGSIAGLSDYMYASTIESTIKYPMSSSSYSTGSMPSATGNYDLKWETSEQLDFGLDARFFRDRLTFAMDWYRKETKDLIMPSATASLDVGNTLSPLNAGNVVNKGFEFELGWKDQIGDFSYGINGNLATLDNEVTYIYETLSRVAGASAGSGLTTYFEVGHPIWYMRGYKYTGVDPSNGYPVFEDIDGDGNINENDLTEIGSGIPDVTYGLTLTLGWKGLDLIVFANGAAGNEVAWGVPRSTRMQANQLKEFYDNRWTSTNTNAKYIGAELHDYAKYVQSSAMVFDGSYFKIKQIQLGYTLPKGLLDKTRFLTNARVYVSLDDFFTFTDYPGFDPEVSMSGSGLGLDYGQYPTTKRFTFGVNVAF